MTAVNPFTVNSWIQKKHINVWAKTTIWISQIRGFIIVGIWQILLIKGHDYQGKWISTFITLKNLERKKVKSLSRARLFATPWIVACTKLLRPWDFQGKSTGVGCHFLLQGIFPTQGSNPGLSHYRQTLYHLSHQGSPEKPKSYAIRMCYLNH